MSEDTYRGHEDLFDRLLTIVIGHPADAGRLAVIELLAAICVQYGKHQNDDFSEAEAILEHSITTLRKALPVVWDEGRFARGDH